MINPSLTAQKSFRQARTVYLLLTILFLAAFLAIGFMKGKEVMAMTSGTRLNETRLTSLREERDSAIKAYTEARVAYAKDFENSSKILEKMVPEGEKYTELTRTFDEFFAKNFDTKNPIVASGLRYGQGQRLEGTPFSSLPVSLTIASSKENFLKFLRYIEQSGSLETGVRFMEVQAIRVNFGEEGVSFTVDLTALYRV